MQLLILTPEFSESGGGIATFYRGLLPALRDLDVSVRVIEGSAMHAGERSPRTVDGAAVETLELDRLRRWRESFAALAAAPKLRGYLAAAWAMWEQAGAVADVIEATDWCLLFVPPAVEARAPLIVQGHGSVGQIGVHDPLAGEEIENALTRSIESAVLSHRPLMQTCSQGNADFWTAETGQQTSMIRPALPVANRTGGTPLTNRGLVVGRIQRWKGPAVLCGALAELGDRAPPIDWIGRDVPFGARQSSTNRHLTEQFPAQWGRIVSPHRPVSPAEVARRQGEALFNLVPSTWDVFNFTAAEAMASGRPTIVASGAGASELIVDGENGYVFAAGDCRSLAGAIERFRSEAPSRHAEIGAAGRETVRRELDPHAIAAARLAAYQVAIDAFHAMPPAPIEGWLGELCRPGAPGSAPGAFLGQFPVRDLASHVALRVAGRAGALLPGSGRAR